MFSPMHVGGWAYGEILTSTQMNQANDDIPFALDGRDGGDYAPTGSLEVQTPTTKDVVLNGCTFYSLADGGRLTCAGLLNAIDDITCAGDLAVTGQTVLTAVTAGALYVSGNVDLGLSSADTLTIASKTRVKQRVRSPKGMIKGGYGGASVYQYAMANYDLVYIPPGQAVASGTIWKLSTANPHYDGVQSGEVLSFRHLGSGTAIVVQDPAGTPMATIGPLGAGTLIRVDIAYDPTEAAYVIVDQGYG